MTTRITDEQLDAFERERKETTQEAWTPRTAVDWSKSDLDYAYAIGPKHETWTDAAKTKPTADAVFMMHAHEYAPALVAELRLHREREKRLEEQIGFLEYHAEQARSVLTEGAARSFENQRRMLLRIRDGK